MSLMGLQVIDRSGARISEYEDVSRIEKFQITDSTYDKRTGEKHCLSPETVSGMLLQFDAWQRLFHVHNEWLLWVDLHGKPVY